MENDGRSPEFIMFLEEAQVAYDRLTAILPLEVNAPVWSLAVRAFLLRAGLLHRTADIADAAIESCRRWRLMPASLMTRAVLETVAVYYCFYQEAEEAVRSQDMGEVGERVVAFVTGSNGHNYKDPQSTDILRAVDGLEELVRGVRERYDLLNIMARPNWAGTVDSYRRISARCVGAYAFDSSRTWLGPEMGPWLLANLLNDVVKVDGCLVDVLNKIACMLGDKSD